MNSNTLQQSDSTPPSGHSGAQSKTKRKRSLLSTFFRFILWSLLALLLLVILIAGLLYLLAGTDAGFSRISNFASERVPGLTIDAPTGNLREGINANSVDFTNDSIAVKASELSSDWRLGCLLKRRLCLDNVHIEQLDVTTFVTEDNEPAPAPERNGAIELPDISLPVDIIISNVSIGTLNFQPPGDAPAQQINNIKLSAHTENSLLTIDNVSLNYQAFATRLTGTVDLTGQYPLALALNVQTDDVLPDNVPEGEGKQPITVQMTLGDSLANLVIGTRISGVADVTMNATVQPLEQNLPATVKIVADELGWPVASKSLIAANGTRISVSGDMGDYDFSLNTSLAGEQVPDTDINIGGKANPRQVSIPTININTLGGNANASALVSLAHPMVWSTRWKLEDIDPSVQLPDLQGELNGNINASGMLSEGRWSLKLERALIEGRLRDLPFRLDAKLSKGLNELWFVERVDLNNDKNQISAQGIVSDKVDIDADINLPQLQNFLPGLAGGFNAKLNAEGSLQSPDIRLQADADVIRFNDILVRSLVIDGDITELFTEASSLDISVDSIRAGANTVDDLAFSLAGNRRDHNLILRADGPKDTDVDLAISGELDDALNWSGLLEKLQSTLPGHDIRLADPVSIGWQNDTQSVSVSPHCWSISNQSNLCLQSPVRTDKTGQATLTLDQYSLQKLNALLPGETRLAGELAANVDLVWGDKGPNDRRAVIATSITQAQVQITDPAGDPVSFGYDTIKLDANVAPDKAIADLKLASQTLGNAQLAIQLDPSDTQSAITGSVNLQDLQLEIAKAFLPDFDTVTGTISAKGELGGTLVAPEYDGSVVLDSPVLQAEILPLPITGGKVTARIAGQNMNLDGEILSDQGSIELDGRGTLDPVNWNIEVNLRGQKLRIVTDPVQDSTINHEINIVANPKRISVSGDIDIPQAVIDVEELPEGAATVSNDIVIIEDEEEAQAAPVTGESGLNLAVALNVSLGENVALSAYGLNANLEGDMDVRIRGNRPPQLGGEIRVVDGIFKQYGQDLAANGQVLFVGPIDSTQLSIDAVRLIETEEPTRTAGLRILGTVTTPEITLFTEPSDKSQDAILSYIILGRDINEASDQEADLLATAALALAVKGGSSLGGGVADALGIEEFGLETRGSGNDAELVVSGRINDRLLLRYGHGVFDSESTLYLRYDLTKKLYLEAAQGAQRAVDLFYSFSF